MKKALLLASALVCASSMMATTTAQRSKSVVKTSAPECMVEMPVAYETFETMATPGQIAARKVTPKAGDGTPRAFYKRPAGAFYGLCASQENNNYKYSSQYSPFLMGWPFRIATYEPNCINVGEVSAYDWTYFLYNRDTRLHEEYSASGPMLDVDYGVMTLDTVPRLFVTSSEGSYNYTINGWSVTGSGTNKAVNKEFRSRYIARVDYQTTFTNTADQSMWCTPKFRAASTNRDATNLAGGTYTSGAKDSDGGTTGKWFGRNASGIDALGMAFEKPQHPYLLRRVGVAFQNLAFASTAPCELKVMVYKLDEMPQYSETASVVAQPGELLAEGKFVMNPNEFTANGITSGMLPFELLIPDDGTGLESYVEPEIDFPILVVFTGYNNSTISDFTLTQGTDLYDEGFGEHCYMGRTQSDGSIKYQGLNNFFTSGERKAGISIYAEVAHPFLTWNLIAETGEKNVAAEGEKFRIPMYTYSPAEEMEVTLEDGSEMPEWLGVEVEDVLSQGEWDNVTDINFTAAALPEGVNYREANVKVHIPGAYIVYKLTQGEKKDDPEVYGDVNGDGVVDVTDVNILINIVLEKASAADYPKADVDGSGNVDVSDVNAVINVVLDK